jgi:hypothetical protein
MEAGKAKQMKKIYLVSAKHISPEWTFDKTRVEVGEHRDGWSAGHPKLGYVCDFDTPEAAIRDLFGASACAITEIVGPISTLKKLSAEGRFECGLDESVKGKVWAFVAVVGEHFGARLGIAFANEQGYCPIPEHWANAERLDEMQDHADELNEAEGKDKRIAAEIVCSTMGGRKIGIIRQHGRDAEGNALVSVEN